MTVTGGQLLAYAGALAVMVLTPGPVVAALVARAATGGVRSAVPLAAAVSIGEMAWPLAAMLGIGVVVGVWADLLVALRWFGAGILVWMGVSLVLNAKAAAQRAAAGLEARGSAWAAFAAGLMAITGNPEAILFYLGVLPGFFDFRTLTPADIAVVCLVSGLVTFLGNLGWAALFARARRWLADPVAMRRTHLAAGCALVVVGVVIAVG